MPTHPLTEVFGFPTTNLSPTAERLRAHKLCPYNNKVPNCTKDKADNPLGVCSIFNGEQTAITCPIRFRQDWLIAEDAARFFFPEDTTWTSLTEVRLNDAHGKSAGNIDIVLVAYDSAGKLLDFGALEVQAVYISGNVRRPFDYYMQDRASRANMDWTSEVNYPRPDYLSSSRKRLAPQLLFKGGILNAWGKKIAVALDQGFFATLPSLRTAQPADAQIAWLVYDLVHNDQADRYSLTQRMTVLTTFSDALEHITRPDVGAPDAFLRHLQARLDEKLDNNNPPDTDTFTLQS